MTTPVADGWLRYHGKAIDELLDYGFWITQPDKIFRTTGVGFTDTQIVDLAEGIHYVIYENSAAVGYIWHAQIFVNDELVAEGDVDRGNQLRGNFKTKEDVITVLPSQKVEVVTLISSGSRHTTPEQGSVGTSLSTKRTRIIRHITWVPVVIVRA